MRKGEAQVFVRVERMWRRMRLAAVSERSRKGRRFKGTDGVVCRRSDHGGWLGPRVAF